MRQIKCDVVKALQTKKYKVAEIFHHGKPTTARNQNDRLEAEGNARAKCTQVIICEETCMDIKKRLTKINSRRLKRDSKLQSY